MKTVSKSNSLKDPVVHYDPTLTDRHKNIVIAPEKLKKVNEDLKKYGFPPANWPHQ